MTQKKSSYIDTDIKDDPEYVTHPPYKVKARVKGITPFLFHRWNIDSIAEKAAAKKGADIKKIDDLESMVYRTLDGELAIPGEYFRCSMANAAKRQSDPSSPRKSACELFKTGIFATTDLCSFGKKHWDFVDRRRVVVQRSGITRSRPALNEGWICEVELQVNLPEYINRNLLRFTLAQAGRLVGLGDFRIANFGKFEIVEFA